MCDFEASSSVYPPSVSPISFAIPHAGIGRPRSRKGAAAEQSRAQSENQEPKGSRTIGEDYIVAVAEGTTRRRISFAVYDGLCKSTSRHVKSRGIRRFASRRFASQARAGRDGAREDGDFNRDNRSLLLITFRRCLPRH